MLRAERGVPHGRGAGQCEDAGERGLAPSERTDRPSVEVGQNPSSAEGPQQRSVTDSMGAWPRCMIPWSHTAAVGLSTRAVLGGGEVSVGPPTGSTSPSSHPARRAARYGAGASTSRGRTERSRSRSRAASTRVGAAARIRASPTSSAIATSTMPRRSTAGSSSASPGFAQQSAAAQRFGGLPNNLSRPTVPASATAAGDGTGRR